MKRAAAPREVETKLSIPDAPAFAALRALRKVGEYQLRRPRQERLVTRYWDNQGRELTTARLALRTRHSTAGDEASVKGPTRVRRAVHERVEVNVALPGPLRQRWSKLPNEIAEVLGARLASGPFTPILVTDIERSTRRVMLGTTQVAELALDRVRIRAPGERRVRLRYLELEAEDRCGDRRHIEALTALLRRQFGLSASTDSKFSAGMKAIRG